MAFPGTVDGRHRTDDDTTLVCVDLDSGDCIRGLTGIQSRANLPSTHPRFGEFRQVGTCSSGWRFRWSRRSVNERPTLARAEIDRRLSGEDVAACRLWAGCHHGNRTYGFRNAGAFLAIR